jgi:hypothetical protein
LAWWHGRSDACRLAQRRDAPSHGGPCLSPSTWLRINSASCATLCGFASVRFDFDPTPAVQLQRRTSEQIGGPCLSKASWPASPLLRVRLF